jgi:hypothetical protein
MDDQLSFRKSANIDRVTDKRKYSLFRLVDTDGSGTIDAQEFAVLYDAIKKDLAEELEKEAALAKEASSARRRFKMLLLFVAVLVSFLAASVAANFAVIFTVVDQAITTTTTQTGLLEVKGTDTIAKMAIATHEVPLVVAPALDLDTLAAAKSLKIKYRSEAGGSQTIEAQVSVVAVRKHNATYVEFVTDVEGDIVEVLNGQAYLSRQPTPGNGLEAPSLYEICAANATCSAFSASGIDVDAALELAKQELVAAGYDEESRRLAPTYAACDPSGTWTYENHCGWKYLGNVNPNWEFVGYCYPNYDSNTSTPMLEHPVSPAWYDYPGYPTPTLSHPIAVGTQVYYWWPPAMAALHSVYYSGWATTKHIVFFAPGKWSQWYYMYDSFCTPGATLTCPSFQIPEFEHLVFVFGGSGLLDHSKNADGTNNDFTWAQGWSVDIYDSINYGTAAGILSTYLYNKVKRYSDHSVMPTYTCKPKYVVECYWTKSKVFDGEESRAAGAKFSSTAPKPMEKRMLAERRDHDGEENEKYVELKLCRKVRRWQCPFNYRSQTMMIGHSDGGAFSMYMNYFSSKVTKAVAIDFWPYMLYEVWLGSTSGGSTFDTTIYTSCVSHVFDHGPASLIPLSTGVGTTYLEGAGIWGDSYFNMPTAADQYGGKDFWNYEWSNPAGRRLSFKVHGLNPANLPTVNISATSVDYSDDSIWAQIDSNGDFVHGTACTENTGSNEMPNVHTTIVGVVPGAGSVNEWLGLSRRRLHREDIFIDDEFEQEAAKTKGKKASIMLGNDFPEKSEHQSVPGAVDRDPPKIDPEATKMLQSKQETVTAEPKYYRLCPDCPKQFFT